MQSLESLKRKLQATDGLRSIVKTMKILAAVTIRQYEKLLNTLDEYNGTIEMGLQVVLKTFDTRTREDKKTGGTGAIIFGSDMGMCGQFNDQIANFARDKLKNIRKETLIAIGERIVPVLDDLKLTPGRMIPYPLSIMGGITPILHDILTAIESWREEFQLESVFLFYNKPVLEGVSYYQNKKMLLPVDPEYLDEIRNREWKSRSMPTFKMNKDKLFATLIRNQIFIALYRAFADSLTSESIARLNSMQAAEKHINERIDDLTLEYNQSRQDAITSEILDIIAGVEALGRKGKK